jgi:hypothetical protein
MRPGSGLLGVGVLLLLLVAVPAHGADDTNSAPLTQGPTVSPQALASALSQLAQGSNDTQLQGLVNQLDTQLESGNYGSAASTLLELQGYSNNNSVPDSLKDLLQSLSINGNGASIDTTLLSKLLGTNAGGAGNLANESPNKMSLDLSTLANLLQGVDPSFASQLLQQSTSFAGVGAIAANSPGPIVTPQAVPNLSFAAPSLATPSLPVSGPAAVPLVSPTALVLPVVVLLAVVALFLSRNALARLVGRQALPGTPLASEGEEPMVIPGDPRRRIAYYFAKTVSVMGRRGVPKMRFETHREFYQKCDERAEKPYVGTISSLYEKAKFSGQEVTQAEADQAARAFSGVGEER